MKVQITSIFAEISEKVFLMKNLDEAKTFIIDFVEGKQINKVDKKKILHETDNAKTLVKLQTYIANACLRYEGLGMNQINKTAKEAAQEESQLN